MNTDRGQGRMTVTAETPPFAAESTPAPGRLAHSSATPERDDNGDAQARRDRQWQAQREARRNRKTHQ